MSIEHISHVWKNSRQSGTHLLMLLAIADYSNDQGEAWPSTVSLAHKCRLSEDQARRVLRALQNDGEIEVETRAGTSNKYRLILPDDDATPRVGAGTTPRVGAGTTPRVGAGAPPAAARGTPRVGAGESSTDPSFNRHLRDDDDGDGDFRFLLLGLAGINPEKIDLNGTRPEDILAELARCADPRNNIRRPDYIAERNLANHNRPHVRYYDPSLWRQLHPAIVEAAIQAGLIEAISAADDEDTEEDQDQQQPAEIEINEPVNDHMSANTAWRAALGQLRLEMPQSAYESWVKGTELISYSDGHFVVGTMNSYTAEWLTSRLGSTVQRLLTGICNRDDIDIKFVVM